MAAVVQDLWRYPLKGARGVKGEYLGIDPKVGIIGDRRFAVRRTTDPLYGWAPKTEFRVGMNTALMVAETPIFQGGPGGNNPNQLDARYLADLARRLDVVGDLHLQDTKGEYNLCDTQGASISFLNLASVKALSEFIGEEVDPRRFRMNVWMTGLEPFEELEWVDRFPGTREILVNQCRFRVDDACERCLAIQANPDTGQYDLKLLKALGELMGMSGYKSPHRGTPIVMGILAVALNHGIMLGQDEVRLA